MKLEIYMVRKTLIVQVLDKKGLLSRLATPDVTGYARIKTDFRYATLLSYVGFHRSHPMTGV